MDAFVEERINGKKKELRDEIDLGKIVGKKKWKKRIYGSKWGSLQDYILVF